MEERIRVVIDQSARLSVPAAELAEHEDLYAAGMTSHASVHLMLALEREFDIEFPDSMLRRSVFESIAAIACALDQLVAATAA